MRIRPSSRQGFSLVEVVVALAVAVFCLLVLVGLLPVGLTSNRTSISQTVAAGFARAIISDLRATPKSNPAVSPEFGFTIPQSGAGSSTAVLYLTQDGTAAGAVNTNASAGSNPLYRVTVVFTTGGSKTSYFGTTSGSATLGSSSLVYARILITWPALADPTATKAPVNYAGSFETYVGLNRT
jgi:uncharacterized protein (TIGR02598 family)